MRDAKKAHTGNPGLYILAATVYISLLILFGFQTWQLVNFLFPQDQLLMKLLTLVSFDVMSLLWGSCDLFYRFASPGAKSIVRWAWAVSFLLSLAASVFYLVLSSMFRFALTVTSVQVDTGYGISIAALTLNILFLSGFLYLDWRPRHPSENEYEEIEQPPARATPHAELAGQTHLPQRVVERVFTESEVTRMLQGLQQPTQHVAGLPGGAPADPLALRLQSEQVNHQATIQNGAKPQGQE